MYYYKAFGMNIQSDFHINMLPPHDPMHAIDVTIRHTDLSDDKNSLPSNVYIQTLADRVFFYVPDVGSFSILNGNTILVDPAHNVQEGLLAVYIMGSCFGAIIHQQHYLPLHGSCVTDGKNAILITGDSGAGKSTLAAEFMSHGWKLLTDDVSLVKDINTDIPIIQSSYPSQKLWDDTKNRFHRTEQTFTLYQENRQNKYGIMVSDFYEGTVPLRIIVRLIPQNQECSLQPIEGFTKVDQLLYNTYRNYFISDENKQNHFQDCVTLSTKVKMFIALRNNEADCSYRVYVKLTEMLKKLT